MLGSVKVKIELWQAGYAALRFLQVQVSTVSSPAGQAFVPTLTLDEIFADKLYALGARKRIKPRDVFDPPAAVSADLQWWLPSSWKVLIWMRFLQMKCCNQRWLQ